MALGDLVKEQFSSRIYLGVPVDGGSHFVATYYTDGQLLLAGHGREMPPFVLFREQSIWISADGTEWRDVTADSGGLAVLALLDPRRVVLAATKAEEMDTVTVNLAQLLNDAGQAAEDVAEDFAGATQLVEFKAEDGVVTEMIQNDIGATEERVAIRFVAAPEAVSLPP